jgi:hypothetical protein
MNFSKALLYFFIGLQIFVLIYIYFAVKLNKVNVSIKLKEKHNDNVCNLEWEKLNSDIYFRKSLSFYFKDVNKIRLYFEKNKNFKYNLTLTVVVSRITKLHYLTTNDMHILNSNNIYQFGYLETNFELIFENDIKVYIKDDQQHVTNLIPLTVKNLNSKNNLKNHSMVCSCAYSFKNEHTKMIDWWVQMNIIHGHTKIVIFNNTIQNSKRFTKLFKKHENILEVVQFQCLPNFLNQKSDYFSSFFDIKNKYGINLYTHFQYFTLNECYLKNMDKYSYIAVNDPDENVMPRGYLSNDYGFKQFREENKLNFMQNLFSNSTSKSVCYKDMMNSNESNLKTYLDNLKRSSKNANRLSFYFKMAVYLKHETVDNIFEKFSSLFKSMTNNNLTYPHVIEIETQKFNFKIEIKNEDDFVYAKYLFELHTKYVRPYLDQNKAILNTISSSYNRFYYLLGQKSTLYFAGKTIYNTNRESVLVSIHAPDIKTDLRYVDKELGHSAHFRSSYNLRSNKYHIKELYFDTNYFSCYFKTILNKN